MKKEDIKKLIKLFAKKTNCSIQHNNCCCNTCFHNIDADFQHICWLIILGLIVMMFFINFVGLSLNHQPSALIGSLVGGIVGLLIVIGMERK